MQTLHGCSNLPVLLNRPAGTVRLDASPSSVPVLSQAAASEYGQKNRLVRSVITQPPTSRHCISAIGDNEMGFHFTRGEQKQVFAA